MRNLAYFLGGFLVIFLVAVVPEIASAAPADNLTVQEYQVGVAETQQILTGIAHSLMLGLGVVAGRFR